MRAYIRARRHKILPEAWTLDQTPEVGTVGKVWHHLLAILYARTTFRPHELHFPQILCEQFYCASI
jgi:hypothetical protein